ncbi:unnamed protein product [Vitrella brassicaformis CCMP3155]|uniref:GDP-L-fucose synthase n=2 Tax=Vitrella brassicaformis TaxID=1169539 RepID=A0A0G4GA91_VITBC|nr:unnamed protein product [Vitrella brassicaformis CCMP3155]|eukprot:CEM25798.1 unnamed protein product [Vitrella brassicaformis CCMP3155]
MASEVNGHPSSSENGVGGGGEVYLVTGGSGLLGQALKRVVEASEGGAAKGSSKWVFLSSKDADLRDYESSRRLFDKHRPTHVVHLAAKVGGLFANMADQVGFFRQNMQMNDNIVSLCHDYKVKRAIFCLSTCVFPPSAPMPLTEDSLHSAPPHPSNEGYANAKRMLECLARYYRQQYNDEFVCIIPTNLYGPNDNFNLEEAHVIPALIHKCYLAQQDNQPFVVSGSGKPLRQFLYSDDCARIIYELLRTSSEKLTFNSMMCVGDTEHSIKQVADAIVSAMEFKGEVKYDTSKADGVYKKTASNAILRGFMPKDFTPIPLEEGIRRAVVWFKDNFDKARR